MLSRVLPISWIQLCMIQSTCTIFSFRWVASHHRAVSKVFNNLPEIVKHLQTIALKTDRISHERGAIKKAKSHIRFLTDKRAIILMVFNLDAQNAFSIQSRLFEATDASIIGMSHAKTRLERDMMNVALFEDNDDSGTKKFLSNVICGDMQANVKCMTLENYEAAEYVIWKGIKLESLHYNGNFQFPLLSELKEGYVNLIIELLQDYFPDLKINDFDILDQRSWNTDVPLVKVTVDAKITSVMKELKTVPPRGVGVKTIAKEFLNLAKKIQESQDWCQINKSTPSMFWSNILRNDNYDMSATLRKIIRSAMSIPAGSAAAERIFAKMNYIKDAHRATLKTENINHILRIRHNGPEQDGIRLEPYADTYVNSGNERCDPLYPPREKRIKLEENDDEIEESDTLYSSIFS